MNFRKSLAAILVGNAIYFLLMPHLPAVARHGLYTVDFGLLLDFGICVAVFAAMGFFAKRFSNRD